MNMDLLKEEKNRGYLIAGIGGLVGLIAFFLPYITFSFLGVGGSVGGASLGWVWFEEIAALVVTAVAVVLIYRNNAFGLTNMPVEKQILYGRYALIGGGALALLIHLLFALTFHNAVAGFDIGISLGFGFWVFLIAAIAMIVGGVLAYRTPMPTAAQSWQYPQSTAYPPYQQPQQPYPPQAPSYPPYQQPYPPTEQPPQQYPQQQYPPQQQPPQQYPQQPPQQQPPQW